MPDEVLHSIQDKQNEYMDKLEKLIPEHLNRPDLYVNCSDKDDITRYILEMVRYALSDSMFMTFDTFNELGLLKKEV